MKKGTINIGPLRDVKVRTRVRLATITELIKDGVVIGTGVAVLHPGEEHKMDFKTGARLAGERAVEGFARAVRLVARAEASRHSWVENLLLQDAINQDERQAKWALTNSAHGDLR